MTRFLLPLLCFCCLLVLFWPFRFQQLTTYGRIHASSRPLAQFIDLHSFTTHISGAHITTSRPYGLITRKEQQHSCSSKRKEKIYLGSCAYCAIWCYRWPIRCVIKMKMSGHWVELSVPIVAGSRRRIMFLMFCIFILLLSWIPFRLAQRPLSSSSNYYCDTIHTHTQTQ